jgi:hypothetical protein
VLALFFTLVLASQVEVERVVALVNGAPILASDVDLAEIADLVPKGADEDDQSYRSAVAEALVLLELRWQDLDSAGVSTRIQVDLDVAWASVLRRVGGEAQLHDRLRAAGLDEAVLRALIRRAAIVQQYVGARFAPFIRPSATEIDTFYRAELAPGLTAAGKPVPDLKEVRSQIETVLRERKLSSEIDRWTEELERRGEVIRYFRR